MTDDSAVQGLGDAVRLFIQQREPAHTSPGCKNEGLEQREWVGDGVSTNCSLCILNRALSKFDATVEAALAAAPGTLPEEEAEAFYQTTGFIQPGKDVAPAMNPSDEYMERRQVAWRAWCAAIRYAVERQKGEGNDGCE